MRVLFFCLVGVLTACADRETLVYKSVPVKVPVPVACVTEPVVPPDFAMRTVRSDDDVAVKVRAALVELYQRRAYEAVLLAR